MTALFWGKPGTGKSFAARIIAPDVDFTALARRFKIAGGDIKKVLVRAAMRAHANQTKISHRLLMDTCSEEYALGGRVTQS